MRESNWKDVAEIIGISAIVVSLVFVGIQMKQSQQLAWADSVLTMRTNVIEEGALQAEHIDINFGDVFSFWDWLFGTLYIPKKNENASIGLSSNEHEAYSSVWELYALPFKNNIRAKQLISTTVLILVLVVAAELSLEILLTKLFDGPNL